MITLNQILGALVVLGALLIGVHEVWVFTHPEEQLFPSTRKRLRRRLTGVVIVFLLVGLLTWAGGTSIPQVKLACYGVCFLIVLVLLALALADARDTTREIVHEHLQMDPEAVNAMMDDPMLEQLMHNLESGPLREEDLRALQARLAANDPRLKDDDRARHE